MSSYDWPGNSASGASGIGGTIDIDQVAVGTGTDLIGGSSLLTYSGGILHVQDNIELSKVLASGAFGANSPIGAYNNGFFSSVEGDLLAAVRSGAETAFLGVTDELAGINMGLNYGTVNPKQMVLGASITDYLVVFNNNLAGNFQLDLSQNPHGSGSFVASNGLATVPTFAFSDGLGLYHTTFEAAASIGFTTGAANFGYFNSSGFFSNATGGIGRFGLNSSDCMTFTADHIAHYALNGVNVANILPTGALNLKQSATPANPSSGFNDLYFKSDNNLYMKNSAGTETQVNGGVSGITALTGDVTASGSGSVAATVALVGGSTAASVHTSQLLTAAATASPTAATLALRDGSGGSAFGGFTVGTNILTAVDAVGNLGAIGATRPLHYYGKGLLAIGDFGAGLDPISLGFARGFWTADGGNSNTLVSRIWNSATIGNMGFEDLTNAGPANYGLIYDTAKPYQIGLGVNTNARQVNFDFSSLANFYLDLSLNPSGAGGFAASNGSIGVPTWTWGNFKTTGVYVIPIGLNAEPQMVFVGPGNFGGVGGQYSNGSIGSNGDGGGGFFGNGYCGAEPTGNYAWNWDFGNSITKYLINGIAYSAQFESNGDLTFDQSFFSCHIGNATGGAPLAVFTPVLQIKQGANQKTGTAVLSGGAVTVSNTSVTANSLILVTSQVDGGVPGFLRITAKTASTSFVITSSSVADTSTVAWWILEGY